MLAAAVVFSMLVLNVGAQAENKLTKSWELGLVKGGEITEGTDTDGTKYISVTGIKNAWDSPMVDILDAVKSAAGDNLEDGADVYVAFDVRIKYAEGADTETPVTAKALLRMAHTFAEGESELFAEQYSGTLFAWSGTSGTNVMHYFQTGLELGSEWMHFEDYLTVDSTELEGAGTAWNLCIDTISDPTAIAALEFKNVGVYDDTYEPVEIEEPEEPEEPAGPTATPMPTAGQQTPFGLSTTAPATTAPATESTAGTGDTDKDNGGNTGTIIVICVVAAVVVAAVIIGVVAAKKKKASGADDTQEPDNKTE